MKIKFDAYDEDLPLNKTFSDLNVIVKSVFQIKDKCYPQIHIHGCECENGISTYFLKTYKWKRISNKLILKIEYITFFNDMINIKDLDPSLIQIDKKSYKNISIYNIRYITIKRISDYENINSVNPLYLIIGEVDGYIECNSTEKNNGNKYLNFASTGKTKSIRKVYKSLG